MSELLKSTCIFLWTHKCKIFIFILITLVCYVVIKLIKNRDYYVPTNKVKYKTKAHDDGSFKEEVSKILKNSGWNIKYDISETNDDKDADILIHLTQREKMEGYKKLEHIPINQPINLETHYPDGSPIYYSYTTQGKTRKPEIYIDKTNWNEGVPFSQLSKEEYREYVINHEFGHALGYDHQKCNNQSHPGDRKNNVIYNTSQTCPVMYQMTRGIPYGGLPNNKVLSADFNKRIKYRYKKFI
jgi:hypothetical protein